MTELGKSYYDETGFYQKEFDKLYKESVPEEGRADYLNGELLRAISRLHHEYYNNGNCNARDYNNNFRHTWDDDDDYDEDDYEIVLNEYYGNFLELIKITLGNVTNLINKIIDIIFIEEPSYSDSEMNIYDSLCDKVMEYVLNNNVNQQIPAWYTN